MVRYMVQPGDTLGNIAGKYETTVQAIVLANGIRNPNMIHVGQILRIPTHHYEDNNNPHHKGEYYYHDNNNYYYPGKHYYHHDDNYKPYYDND